MIYRSRNSSGLTSAIFVSINRIESCNAIRCAKLPMNTYWNDFVGSFFNPIVSIFWQKTAAKIVNIFEWNSVLIFFCNFFIVSNCWYCRCNILNCSLLVVSIFEREGRTFQFSRWFFRRFDFIWIIFVPLQIEYSIVLSLTLMTKESSSCIR